MQKGKLLLGAETAVMMEIIAPFKACAAQYMYAGLHCPPFRWPQFTTCISCVAVSSTACTCLPAYSQIFQVSLLGTARCPVGDAKGIQGEGDWQEGGTKGWPGGVQEGFP